LPAMQTPRSFSNTEVMLSQASQLPQKCSPTFSSALNQNLRVQTMVL